MFNPCADDLECLGSTDPHSFGDGVPGKLITAFPDEVIDSIEGCDPFRLVVEGYIRGVGGILVPWFGLRPV